LFHQPVPNNSPSNSAHTTHLGSPVLSLLGTVENHGKNGQNHGNVFEKNSQNQGRIATENMAVPIIISNVYHHHNLKGEIFIR